MPALIFGQIQVGEIMILCLEPRSQGDTIIIYCISAYCQCNLTNQLIRSYTLQETNISPKNGILKMIFLFPFGGIC